MAKKKVPEPVQYLGPGVSSALQFHGGDDDKLAERGLPLMHTMEEVAAALSVNRQQLLWLVRCDTVARADHYRRFTIPKRSGGIRKIAQPKQYLASAQRWVAENILDKCHVNSSATAFRPGLSIVDNARAHVGREVVLRVDIKDFFPTIKFARVRGFFESLGYNPGVASLLAILCTDDEPQESPLKSFTGSLRTGVRRLPQGACTSPQLANLIASRLDRRIKAVLRAMKTEVGEWAYTRYADDLVLSTCDHDTQVGKVLQVVKRLIRAEGFQPNEKKTAIMRAPSRQLVTGIVVGEELRLPREYLRKVRALLHACEARGFESTSEDLGADALHVARGHYAYVAMVMPERATALALRYPWLRA